MTPRIALLAIAASLAGLSPAASQSPAAPPAAPRAAAKPAPAAPPVFEGEVLGPDGKPVAGAVVVVFLTSGGWYEPPVVARTGDDGRFRVSVKRRAPHGIRVEAAGLAAQRIDKASPGTEVRVRLARGGTIEGVVRDAATRDPVAGARVEAREERGTPMVPSEPAIGVVTARTDANGAFRLEGLAPGRHALAASSRTRGRGMRANVALGQGVEILLVAGAAVTGRVRAPDGAPVAGAAVRIEPEIGPGHNRTAATDADGRFEFAGLAPGVYRVVVQHRDFAFALAGGLRPERGADTEVEVTLAPPVRVTGRLVDEKGQPLAGTVSLQELDGVPMSWTPVTLVRAEAGDDGRFALAAIPPGSHTLAAAGRGVAARRLPVDVGARQKEVDLGDVVMEAGAQIRGRVRSAAGAPVADARVLAFSPGSGMLHPMEGRTDADGAFALGGAAPAAYEVRAHAPGFAHASRRVDAPADGVELVLEAAGTITGTVVDSAGRPVDAFDVVAMPREGMGQGPYRARTILDDGRFEVEDVAPGTYVLRVAAGGRGRAVVSDVTVRAGAATDVGRVRLTAAGVVRGTVVDAARAPIAGATVEARASDRTSFAFADRVEATTDTAGRFELAGLAPGRSLVIARHPEYADGVSTPVEVDPAQPAETSIVLTRGGRIEGVVRWRTPSPPERAWIMVQPATALGPSGMPPGGFVTSDGTFAVDRVPAGRARVSLMVRDAGSGRSGPGAFKEAEVREGETARVEFVWREILVRGKVTRGRVPLPGVRLLASGPSATMSYGGRPIAPPPAGPQRMTAVTREDGSYEMLVGDTGRMTIRAEALVGGRSFPARTIEVADADAQTIDLDFPATGVTGVVVDDATEAPVGDAFVAAMAGPSLHVGVRATSTADGRFAIDAEPGDYRLRVVAEGYAAETVDVTVGEGPNEVRVRLSHGERLRGTVVDARGRPVAGVWVTAREEREHGAASSGQSGFDGTFEIGSLRPGTYSIVAGSPLEGFATATGVSTQAEAPVLRLAAAGRVRVTVLGSDGRPAEGAWVRVRSVDGVGFALPIHSPRTGADGAVAVECPAGSVEIHASKEAASGSGRATVAPGGVAALEIRMSVGPPPPGR